MPVFVALLGGMQVAAAWAPIRNSDRYVDITEVVIDVESSELGETIQEVEEVIEDEDSEEVLDVVTVKVTHYGTSFNGRPLGCSSPHGGTYRSEDSTIVAVPWRRGNAYPSRDHEWKCGTRFRITGPGGSIIAKRRDSCGGCSRNHLDLSESANMAVCGGTRPHTCHNVTVEVLGE